MYGWVICISAKQDLYKINNRQKKKNWVKFNYLN